MRPTAKRRVEPTTGVFRFKEQSFVSSSASGTTDFLIFQETLFQKRNNPHKLPWEKDFGKMIQGPQMSFPPPELPRIGRLESSMSLVAETANQEPRPQVIARQRLLSARMAASDDHLRDLSLRKAREIILYKPEDSIVGRALLTVAGELSSVDTILQSLKDSIAHKAVGTSVKRISDYHAFSRWILKEGIGRPMAPTEQDVYNYMC